MTMPQDASQDEDAEWKARLGKVLKGKWTLDSILGVGGTAAVYAATHRNRTRAAIKILHAEVARDPRMCERFLREGYVSNKIDHPACVAVLDDDVTELGEPFLVMELLEGDTLKDVWRRVGRVMPMEMALGYAEPILDCLVACHALPVIHRDLKPGNIFVTQTGLVKVLDFGVAQMRTETDERTTTGTAIGTPHYMAPEQAMGLVDDLDGRADVFAVGAILHALLTGQRIHVGRSESESMVMAATKPVPSVARIAPDLPVKVVALVDKALAWDRRNRFGSAREMQNAVREILGWAPVEGPKPAMSRTALVPAAGPLGSPTGSFAAVVVSQTPEELEKAEEERRRKVEGAVSAGKDLMKHLDRLLPNVRQFGWEHPVTQRALRLAHDQLDAALRGDLQELVFAVEPYSFLVGGQSVWEPTAPADVVPYNLYAAGVRNVRFRTPLPLRELQAFLSIILLDPATDLAPEDDLVTMAWDANLRSVTMEVAEAFAQGDAAARQAFYEASDELEKQALAAAKASHLEARAMVVSTKKKEKHERDVLLQGQSLDPVLREALEQKLRVPRFEWGQRYQDVFLAAYIHAVLSKDLVPFLTSVRQSSLEMLRHGDWEKSLGLLEALDDRLTHQVAPTDKARLMSAIVGAFYGAELFPQVLSNAGANPDHFRRFLPFFDQFSAREMVSVAKGLDATQDPGVRKLLKAFVLRALPGREAELSPVFAGNLSVDSRILLLQALAEAGTKEARALLEQFLKSDNEELRFEARVLLAKSPEALLADLVTLLEGNNAVLRTRAVTAMRRYRLDKGWPHLAKKLKAPGFHELGEDERREIFRGLVALGGDKADSVLFELIAKGTLLPSSSREVSRALAVEAVGDFSVSAQTEASLRQALDEGVRGSEELRQGVQGALAKIAARRALASGAGRPS